MSDSATSPGENAAGTLEAILAKVSDLERLVNATATQSQQLGPQIEQHLTDLAITVLEGQQQATSRLIPQLEQASAHLERTASRIDCSANCSSEGSSTEVLTDLREQLHRLQTACSRPCGVEDSFPAHSQKLHEVIESSHAQTSALLLSAKAELQQQMSALAQGSGQPQMATNQELLDELRMLWRKQEVYVLGLRGGLKDDLQQMHEHLRAQMNTDTKTELDASRTALGVLFRQTLGPRGRTLPQPEPPAPPASRTPVGGIVILSSLVSALVTWLLMVLFG